MRQKILYFTEKTKSKPKQLRKASTRAYTQRKIHQIGNTQREEKIPEEKQKPE